MGAASYGLNAQTLRALELTQAAWRRDRFVEQKNKEVHCREDFVSYPLVIVIGSGAHLGWGYRGNERRSRSWP